jgi:3-phenylpropionate/trans-cinnamate dioxygenase ferredoxin reductase subunit
MTRRIVIAGAGHAAGQAIATLRRKGFDGEIVLVGEESWLPYQRPPLSKKFLAGEMSPERLYFKPPAFYDDAAIDVRLNTRITTIDREARTIETDCGDPVHYDELLLALGSRVRRLNVTGSDLAGIHYVRSIADVSRIRAEMDTARNVVIVGAGYIGLEVAAVARQLGHVVTVLETENRVMSRTVSPVVSEFYEAQHAAQGVVLHLSTTLEEFIGGDRVAAVTTTDAKTVTADLVIVGVGILPNTELAAAAGLEVDDGIVVDERCRTGDDRIHAIGDCTSHPNAIYGRRVRLESVHNALEQAKTAAANICGEDVEYTQVPWFWSDQYDLKLQIAGLSAGYDRTVTRGNPDERSFSCLYLKAGRLIACDSVNAPRDFMQSKSLIAERKVVAENDLADTSIPLKDLV